MSNIIENIIARHTFNGVEDKSQLDAIFTHERRLIVEAPAGYGKTTTMVSKIAYLLATNQVPKPKQILALTFSINAAFKMRKEIAQALPTLLSTTQISSRNAAASVYVSNYHGLCRRILSRYGYLLRPELRRIDQLKGVGIDVYDDHRYTVGRMTDKLSICDLHLENEDLHFLIEFSRNIKIAGNQSEYQAASATISRETEHYLAIVKDQFLPKGLITFDAILLFVRQLFASYPEIHGFYQRFFQTIFVDEFQDTNILQWGLLTDLMDTRSQFGNSLYVFGDHHQQIYEFIGAMDGIFDRAQADYTMSRLVLSINHRFRDQPALRTLDAHLRALMSDVTTHPESTATVSVIESTNQDDESNRILAQLIALEEETPERGIAVLFRSGKDNPNTARVIQHLNAAKATGFSYFYALYGDEDTEYIDFHSSCLTQLYNHLKDCRSIRKLCEGIQRSMEISNPSDTWASLQVLFSTFLNQITKDYRFLSFEDKIELIVDTLRNRALKQYLMYVEDARITVTTIHGAKGLEWDHVIIPDMEKNSFPPFPALCRICTDGARCQPVWEHVTGNATFIGLLKSELNVFYVASTRARRTVLYAYSKQGFNASGNPRRNNLSCFLRLPGLHVQM